MVKSVEYCTIFILYGVHRLRIGHLVQGLSTDDNLFLKNKLIRTWSLWFGGKFYQELWRTTSKASMVESFLMKAYQGNHPMHTFESWSRVSQPKFSPGLVLQNEMSVSDLCTMWLLECKQERLSTWG